MAVRVCDFGLASESSEEDRWKVGEGTPEYLAPEMILGNAPAPGGGKVTRGAGGGGGGGAGLGAGAAAGGGSWRAPDAYAFGVTLCSLLTGALPFAEHAFHSPFVLMDAVLKTGLRPALARDEAALGRDPEAGREGIAEAKEKAAKLVRRCWDNAPAKRPTFGRIVADLQRMLRKLPGGPPGAPASPSKRAQQRGLE